MMVWDDDKDSKGNGIRLIDWVAIILTGLIIWAVVILCFSL